ncbi:MAG TPA: hypothetical protein VKQ30_20825 [Ktedonobacterales bacterium]|nr:hypothetical protein [Ktedonobacterales bacterium]
MAFRCKVAVESITQHNWNPSARTIKFSAQYDDTIPEDKRFYDATPSATFEMLVNNPIVIEQLKPGKKFYVDFTEI